MLTRLIVCIGLVKPETDKCRYPTLLLFFFCHLDFAIKFTETEKVVLRYGFVWVNWAAYYVHEDDEWYSVGGSFSVVS